MLHQRMRVVRGLGVESVGRADEEAPSLPLGNEWDEETASLHPEPDAYPRLFEHSSQRSEGTRLFRPVVQRWQGSDQSII